MLGNILNSLNGGGTGNSAGKIARIMFGLTVALMLTVQTIGPGARAAAPPPPDEVYVEADPDPLGGFNRAMFFIHDTIDIIAISPVAHVYNAVLPQFVRDSVSNFLANVATPITLANDILQGEYVRAEQTFSRFMINSTIGMAGIVDAAAHGGIAPHYEDFGQTMAVYGVGSGPYIFVPIIGPSTPRHLIGRIADAALSPWTWIFWNSPTHIAAIPAGATLISARANNAATLSALRETSPDYYASIRNLYLQSRVHEINNGEENYDDLPDIPDVER